MNNPKLSNEISYSDEELKELACELSSFVKKRLSSNKSVFRKKKIIIIISRKKEKIHIKLKINLPRTIQALFQCPLIFLPPLFI